MTRCRPRRGGGWPAALPLLCLLLPAAAIGAAGEFRPWPVLASRSHSQCPAPAHGERVRTLRSAAQWQRAMAMPVEQAVGEAVDWRNHQVLVYTLPQQRTLGVSVAVAAGDRALQVTGRSAVLQVTVTRPGPDEMAAMALSRPCLVVKVAQRRWRHLEVQETAH